LQALIYTNIIFVLTTYLFSFRFYNLSTYRLNLTDFKLKKWKLINIYLVLLISLTISYLTSSTNFIWVASYGGSNYRYDPIIPGIFWKILVSFILTFLFLVSKNSKHKLTSSIILFSAFFIYMGRGDRGGFLPLWITYMFLVLFEKKYVLFLFLTLATVYFVVFWSPFRSTLYSFGLYESVIYSHNQFLDFIDIDGYINYYNYYLFPLLPQSVWHWHHSFNLYNTGNILGFKPFFNILLQIFPNFIFNIFGYERPLNLAWKLAEFRTHGGGMFHLAGAYWSLGFLGVFIWSFLVNLWLNFIEKKLKPDSLIKFVFYFILAGSCFYTIFYGWQPFIKLCVIILLIDIIVSWIKK